jgi:hypothetical protein
MRRSEWKRAGLAVLLFVAATAVHAQCVSTVRVVSQPLVFPNHGAGAVAWSGSILGVMKTDAETGDVYFGGYDDNLNQIVPDVRIGPRITSGATALVFNGSEFAFFYENASQQIVFQRISTAGAPIGGPIPVAPHTFTWPNPVWDVVWDAHRNAYDVAHTIPSGFETGLWLSIVDRTGSVIADRVVATFIAPSPEPRIAVTPAGVIGATWLRRDPVGDSLFFSSYDASTNFLGSAQVTLTGHDNRLATNGTEFLIVTSDATPDHVNELRATRLDLKGNIIAAESTLITARGGEIAPRSLIWNPTLREYALTYGDSIPGFQIFPGDIRLHRFDFAKPASDTFFATESTKTTFDAPYRLVWTGSSYTTPIARNVSRAEGSDTHLAKHCPLLLNATVPATVALNSFVQFVATPSGGSPRYRYDWDFGDLSRGDTQSPVHQYVRTGTYVVTLTVTDNAGAITRTSSVVRVLIEKHRVARH